MSTEPSTNLKRITEQCVDFKNTLEAKLMQKPGIREKARAALKPGEMDYLHEQLTAITIESMAYAFGGEPSEEFLKRNIAIVNFTTDVALRVVSKDEVSACFPAKLKNKADADILRQIGFNALADLAEPVKVQPSVKTKKKAAPKR